MQQSIHHRRISSDLRSGRDFLRRSRLPAPVRIQSKQRFLATFPTRRYIRRRSSRCDRVKSLEIQCFVPLMPKQHDSQALVGTHQNRSTQKTTTHLNILSRRGILSKIKLVSRQVQAPMSYHLQLANKCSQRSPTTMAWDSAKANDHHFCAFITMLGLVSMAWAYLHAKSRSIHAKKLRALSSFHAVLVTRRPLRRQRTRRKLSQDRVRINYPLDCAVEGHHILFGLPLKHLSLVVKNLAAPSELAKTELPEREWNLTLEGFKCSSQMWPWSLMLVPVGNPTGICVNNQGEAPGDCDSAIPPREVTSGMPL